jgi:hypothetical protein
MERAGHIKRSIGVCVKIVTFWESSETYRLIFKSYVLIKESRANFLKLLNVCFSYLDENLYSKKSIYKLSFK